ncbi:hypothetical protein C0989_006928 [Termitomyces sp. Mn162]|nr:hypothetical protein C0989_006928 [Termitomyces sp. Mn162]
MTKRRASRSPSSRSPKRHAGSSPEEGEVDDSSPGASLAPSPVPYLLPKPATAPPKPKVAFPFKRKGNHTITRVPLPFFDPKDGPGVYDRSAEDEEKFASRQRNNGRESHNRDTWVSYNGSPSDRRRRPPAPRQNSYRSSRSRSPRSHRSRSPSSPPHEGKHRLPPRRSPANYGSFSPLSKGNYNHDGGRVRATYDRNDAHELDCRRGSDLNRNHNHFSRNENRFYRPTYENDHYGPPRPEDYHRGYKDRSFRDRNDLWDKDYSHRRVDNYSRHPHPPAPYSMLPPPEPKPNSLPPQPKSSPPPEPPPDPRLIKDTTLPQEHQTVSIALKRPPPLHEGPSSPYHSAPPPSLNDLMERKKEDDRRKEEDKRKDERTREDEMREKEGRRREKEKEAKEEGRKQGGRKEDEKRGDNWKREDKQEQESLKAKYYRRRNIVRRSPDEEMKAYGRKFEGCGLQSDYDVTTKLGEGTFGEVHKAIHKETGRHVALKRILMHNEKEGMPVTALREIKILKALKHPSIIEILDMFVVRGTEKDPLSVYMVFPYMDHDLAGLLENDRVKLQPSQIKLYMKQLLEGTEYMHRNNILHRDMKAANLLISNTGSLRIADFGLARAYDSNVTRVGSDGRIKERKYTNCVVTRWYRPPELLLGARQYGGEVDIWGIGCVLGEMFNRRPILPGNSDLDQLEKIWQLCGTPNQHTWPNFDALPGCDGVKRFQTHSRRVKQTWDRERITAAEALDHEYFWTDPLPADPKTLPTYEASHEFDRRGQRQQPPPMHHPANYPPYNIQTVSRGRTGFPLSVPPHDFVLNRNPHNHNPHNHNRPVPYPSHGPPRGPPQPSHPHNYHVYGSSDNRAHPNQPSDQSRCTVGGGGTWRGPPHYDNQRASSGDRWIPRHSSSHPPHLPARPLAPMGIGSHPGDPGRHGDTSHPPPGGGEDRLNYG